MLDRRIPIPISEAVHEVMNYKIEGQKEFVSIFESHNRYLSEDLIATNDVPHFDKAPYDGFRYSFAGFHTSIVI